MTQTHMTQTHSDGQSSCVAVTGKEVSKVELCVGRLRPRFEGTVSNFLLPLLHCSCTAGAVPNPVLSPDLPNLSVSHIHLRTPSTPPALPHSAPGLLSPTAIRLGRSLFRVSDGGGGFVSPPPLSSLAVIHGTQLSDVTVGSTAIGRTGVSLKVMAVDEYCTLPPFTRQTLFCLSTQVNPFTTNANI